jgi:predicted RNA binding protein YcfA (HicA-like mRNA interferase family)/predicted RNase H-like HicB family nuclease
MLRNSRDIIRRLEQDGFVLTTGAGSHHKFRHPVSKRTVIVKHPRKDTPVGTVLSIYRQAGWIKGLTMPVPHYIALIHKDTDSGYGISFPDLLGVTTVADTLDEAMVEAAEVLDLALEDWEGGPPVPRTLEQLRADPEFLQWSADAVVVAVRPGAAVYEAAQ